MKGEGFVGEFPRVSEDIWVFECVKVEPEAEGDREAVGETVFED